jgi:hypothetical protein
MRWRSARVLVALPVALLFVACGLRDAPPPAPTAAAPAFSSNLLANAGFESGDAPWTFRQGQAEWSGFAVSDTFAHSGSHSLSLRLAPNGDAATATRTFISGAIQNIKPADFPEFLSGFYRVEDWQPKATFQYVQFVIAVHGSDFGDGFNIREIRFPIAGVDREPFQVSNARFVFLGRAAPKLRAWTYFAFPVKQAFLDQWKAVPAKWDSIDVFFEVRYDGKTPDQGNGSAQVYFDDLYAGPQAANPNRPPAP